jgi:hypothetical protein
MWSRIWAIYRGWQIKRQAVSDLPNRLSKQQLHFMALIFVTTLKIVTLRTLWTWRSWNRASWHNYENNQQDALYRFIYYSTSAVYVSGDVFPHHQEHLNVFTVSGSVQPSCCRLVSRMSWKPDTVNAVKCSWWWVKTSPETCRADFE